MVKLTVIFVYKKKPPQGGANSRLLSQCLAGVFDVHSFVALGGDYEGVGDGFTDFGLFIDNILIILRFANGVFINAVDLDFVNILQPLELLAVQGDFFRT